MNNRVKADIDFEKELWAAANELRGAVAENQYKDYVLSLLFLKHMSEKYEIRKGELKNLLQDEYYIGKFAMAEGSGAGQFFTPGSIVRLLVEMLEPYEGRIFDPACGSGGMFVQSVKFVTAHGGNKSDISIYGQERYEGTLRLLK